MNSVTPTSSSIHRILRYMEWGLIATFILMALINGVWSISAALSWQIAILLTTYAGLSWLFPIQALLWVRQGYVVLGIVLFLWGNSIGLGFQPFFFLYIVKSCFLLSRKRVIFTTVVAGIAAILVSVSALPIITQVQPFWAIDLSNPNRILQFALGELLGTYFPASIFAIPLGCMVVAEQNSRHRAETLAQQVEDLVAALERTRIARDIHDSLGHTLTALRVYLSVAQKSFHSNSHDALQALKTAKLLADQSIEEVQQTVRTLRQSDFNLNQASVILLEQIRKNPSLSVHWDINLPPLPLQTSHHLYCIVKEGLMNIQKHADASQIHLRGRSTIDSILLELEDNGRGFDPQVPHSGFGLKGIAERVQTLGGQLTVHSAFGVGTQIQVVIPL